MKKPIILITDDGKETELPGMWTICHKCRGKGHSSAHLGVVDRNDFTDEEWAQYLEGGYDRPCGCSDGKLWIINPIACTIEEWNAWTEQQRDFAAIDRMSEMERQMGA